MRFKSTVTTREELEFAISRFFRKACGIRIYDGNFFAEVTTTYQKTDLGGRPWWICPRWNFAETKDFPPRDKWKRTGADYPANIRMTTYDSSFARTIADTMQDEYNIGGDGQPAINEAAKQADWISENTERYSSISSRCEKCSQIESETIEHRCGYCAEDTVCCQLKQSAALTRTCRPCAPIVDNHLKSGLPANMHYWLIKTVTGCIYRDAKAKFHRHEVDFVASSRLIVEQTDRFIDWQNLLFYDPYL